MKQLLLLPRAEHAGSARLGGIGARAWPMRLSACGTNTVNSASSLMSKPATSSSAAQPPGSCSGRLVRAARYFNEPQVSYRKPKRLAGHFVKNDLRNGVHLRRPGRCPRRSRQRIRLRPGGIVCRTPAGDRQRRMGQLPRATRSASVPRGSSVTITASRKIPRSAQDQCPQHRRGLGQCSEQARGTGGLRAFRGQSVQTLARHRRRDGARTCSATLPTAVPQYLSRARPPARHHSTRAGCANASTSATGKAENNVGGNITFGAVWCEIALMLTTAEIPGVYVNTDTKRVVVFDHVEARTRRRSVW